jgi:hypothetical protein
MLTAAVPCARQTELATRFLFLLVHHVHCRLSEINKTPLQSLPPVSAP